MAMQSVEVLWPHEEAVAREHFWAPLEEELWTLATVQDKVGVGG